MIWGCYGGVRLLIAKSQNSFTYITPSTMGKVSVLSDTGFWHRAELSPGLHVLFGVLEAVNVNSLAANVRVARSRITLVPFSSGATSSCGIHLGCKSPS